MNPTTDKIQLSQADYNNIADWAKPNYTVAPNSVASTVPLQQPKSAIPSTALQPVQNIKVPEVKHVDTGSQAIVASTQPSIDTALQNFNQAQTAVGTQAEDARSALTKLAESIFGQKADAQANQANLETQLGLETQQNALNKINTDIAEQNKAMREEEDRIRTGYGTEAQKQISRNTILDTYGRRLADLSILQSAVNGNIERIKSEAERKTKLLTAPLDTKIQYLQTFAKDNVDYLDKKQSEKLAFLVDDLKTQKADIQALENAKAQMIAEISNNGGGTNTALIDRLTKAKSLAEVSSIGASSGYIGKIDRAYKLAQISKLDAESRASTGLSLNPQNATQYAGALSVILGSGKFTKDQKASVINAINNGEDPIAVIKNQAKSLMTGANQTKVENYESAKAAMQDLQSALDNYYKLGGDTGIFKGSFEKSINKLGAVSDPKLVSIATQISSALQLYRNAVSGTAYSVQEGKEMESVFPGIKKGKVLNNAIIQGRLNAFDSNIDGAYASVLGENAYNSIRPEDLSTKSNSDFLNSIPNAGTSSQDNKSFFNQFNIK